MALNTDISTLKDNVRDSIQNNMESAFGLNGVAGYTPAELVKFANAVGSGVIDNLIPYLIANTELKGAISDPSVEVDTGTGVGAVTAPEVSGGIC